MEVNTNFRLLLWGVSIIQPSSPDEVLGYLKAVLNDDGLLPEIEVMEDYFDKLKKLGILNRFRREIIYSLLPLKETKNYHQG
ncbi:hypothetical protein [Klebsiella pneumoniae]|uniref:hypothetical protein n=1 Tax=Klebsiella pneumoniae TaxID=573 RepID=UPI0021625940|nr:hypothetical protein [Klebsiella pneumoniae]MED6038245.1 hypothetical protein [Klebsiella pneumoniae]